MSAMLDYMQLCRLCLVKEKVNVPIFDEQSDVRQIYLKISACLPVKISRDDSLPKNICDSCCYKVDLLYQFWNTTVNAEKQLTEWLGNLGVDISKTAGTTSAQHSTPAESIVLKQENHDPPEVQNVEQIPEFLPSTQIYTNYNQQFASSNVPNDNLNSSVNNEPAKVKRRGRPPGSTKKKPPPATQTSTNTEDESNDEGSTLNEPDLEDSDESMEDGKRIAKEEQESDLEYEENEALEPTTFVGVTSETPCDTEQPGPSGLNKPATITASEAGYRRKKKNKKKYTRTSTIKIPLIWNNNNQKDTEYDEMTIKVEPFDIDWEDDLTLDDLKNRMGITTKERKNTLNALKVLRKPQKNICVICQFVIRGRTALINHYLIHKENRIKINTEKISTSEDNDFLRCCICMEEFIEKTELDKHAYYHIERPFFCELCNKSFKQTQNFLTHMSSHEETREPMKCGVCDFKTAFKLAFDKHTKSHSREEYRCQICDKVFPVRTWFIEHKNYHSGEKPFSCEECGKCFPYSRYLTAHKKSMHPHCYFKEPELNECKICQKRYSHKNSLRLHMKSHTGENKYLCDVCGKSLSSSDKLQLHKRIHTGYKPYACNVCEKAFTKKDILTDHLRVHSGEKPFACETCGKCFSQRSPLTIHKRYHTGERPYVCHLCNKGFVSKGILGIHLKQGKH